LAAIEDSDGDDLVAYVKALEKVELEEIDDLIGDDEEADA
jgi:hypothetical protein